MASLYSDGIEIKISFHDLDNCGDILYSYEFLFDGKNIFNPDIIHERHKQGKFITTECDFDRSGVIEFFQRIIANKEGGSYESLEPPIIYIKCNGWKEKRDYFMNSWKNDYHHNGIKKYSNGFIDSMETTWEKDIELIFSLDENYTINKRLYTKLSLCFISNTDSLQEFVDNLTSEFITFKEIKKNVYTRTNKNSS